MLSVLSFWVSVRTKKKNCGTYRLKLYTKAPENITFLNNKFGIIVILAILNFISLNSFTALIYFKIYHFQEATKKLSILFYLGVHTVYKAGD